MEFILGHEIYFIIGWLLLIFSLERVTKRFSVPTNVQDGGLNRWAKNGAFLIINKLAAIALILPIVIWSTSVDLWTRPAWMTGAIALIINVMILDLASYWFHRISHRTPFLWRFHEIHHLDSALDTTTGLRVHFGELVFQSLFRAIPIIAFSMSLESVLVFEFILIMEGLFHHSNIPIPKKLEKLLSFVIITPSRHYVHHHALVKDTDSNYGFIFVWWDKLFGSFNTAERKHTWYMGLEYAPDLSCIQLLISPFKRVKLKQRMQREGYKVVENVS